MQTIQRRVGPAWRRTPLLGFLAVPILAIAFLPQTAVATGTTAVGGGVQSGGTLDAPVVGMATDPVGGGYWLVASNGGVASFDAPYLGSMAGDPLNAPVVGVAATHDGGGYWEVASDGGIFSFGDASFQGSMGGHPLNAPVVGIANDPGCGGYWEVASDGGIFAFDAPYFGSMGGRTLNEPVVGMIATRDGGGYWLVASDGGIFSFGDAAFQGSMGNRSLNAPITGIATDPATGGYWEVASDGGVFDFGAPFFGSMGGQALSAPVKAIVPAGGGGGYFEAGAAGAVFTFGNAHYIGSATVVTGHPLLPPQEPAANITPSPVYTLEAGVTTSGVPPCWQTTNGGSWTAVPSSAACLAAEVSATNNARATEGLPGLRLPSNYASLTPQEQMLVVTDIERVSRGEQPIVGLSSSLDTYAQPAANRDADASFNLAAIPSSVWWGSNWAGGVMNALDANYTWMYNDGWGGSNTTNADCTSPTAAGCWGHRNNILAPDYGTLVMGAGYASQGSAMVSLTELFVAVGNPANVPPLYYTWTDAVAAGAGV